MAKFDTLPQGLPGFSGVARLFPLPNLVLFPHVLQPLHVFEPRYRQMTEAALAGDHLITIVMLEPGWEKDYEGRPPVAAIGCLGRIASHHRLKDGRYNLLLQGLSRVRLVKELPPDKPFREAQVELLRDGYSPEGAVQRAEVSRQILERFRDLVPRLEVVRESIEQLVAEDLPLGMLTDIVGYALDFSPQIKQTLLAEQDVDRRAALILERLAAAANDRLPARAQAERFPPDFSSN